MLAYTARRIVYVVPIVISVALVCFLLVHITPGDPLVAVLPADASQELAAQLRAAYGFDRPLPVQFGLWLLRALHGDLGNSIATGRPVLAEVMRAVGNTVTLAIAAAIIGFTMGILLGLIAGISARPGSTRSRPPLPSPASRCRITGSAWCWSSSSRCS
ncbi:ABC-type dipeptide/oligopeptide/nickel transport system permease component [Bradyrhizobium diazoefficiens]